MTPWVLVTGGAKRLGRAVCEAFAAAGWNVCVHHLRSGEAAQALCTELRARGVRADTVQGDLCDARAVARWFAQACATMGRAPQAVVCNASLFEPDTGRDLAPDLLAEQLQVNLIAPMQLGSLLWHAIDAQRQPGDAVHDPQHEATARPSVIHVLDQKVFNLNPDYFSYTLTKLALERAVVLQAQALAPQVRVNAVAPGLMYLSGPQSEDNFARASRVNALQQPIDPADVARAAVYLATAAACTGTTVRVDNGQHLVPLGRDVMFAVDHLQAGVLPGSA
ncbi:hypothetical protein CCO03_18340 [Comamonas serinivorans]|uniref:Short-chain dehydrogenase n=1 Tax=Comamonas serinivorans TaxID=1082851 RepID=A0A1Y0ESH0_9BURK|nr:SDR family oxidoreductase [Comamonas serinivorans]ARU06360.1 hypothetical protein CCO03_18340 [Comamonas serinivorans]